MATSASAVSITTTPSTIPMTARRAALASLAEKNFWYIPLSPSSRRNVGRETPITHSRLWPPVGAVKFSGSRASTSPTPPTWNTM